VYADDALEIEVTNPSSRDGVSPAGHGLVGMRERAALVGGVMEAARANGTFRVHARLPYVEEPA
jgi:signal transduction histidine kinase